MKKIMMIAAMMVAAVSANAQVYLGGGVGVATSSYDGNSTTVWSILPEVGYNINDKWAVGTVIGYGESKVKVAGVSEKVKTFQVSPYARYTFVKFDHVNLFIDGGVGYKHEDYAGMKTNTFGIGLKPGVAVNLNEKLSFVAHVGFLGYKYDKDDYEGAKAANTFGLDLDGTNLSFGLYYNF